MFLKNEKYMSNHLSSLANLPFKNDELKNSIATDISTKSYLLSLNNIKKKRIFTKEGLEGVVNYIFKIKSRDEIKDKKIFESIPRIIFSNIVDTEFSLNFSDLVNIPKKIKYVLSENLYAELVFKNNKIYFKTKNKKVDITDLSFIVAIVKKMYNVSKEYVEDIEEKIKDRNLMILFKMFKNIINDSSLEKSNNFLKAIKNRNSANFKRFNPSSRLGKRKEIIPVGREEAKVGDEEDEEDEEEEEEEEEKRKKEEEEKRKKKEEEKRKEEEEEEKKRKEEEEKRKKEEKRKEEEEEKKEKEKKEKEKKRKKEKEEEKLIKNNKNNKDEGDIDSLISDLLASDDENAKLNKNKEKSVGGKKFSKSRNKVFSTKMDLLKNIKNGINLLKTSSDVENFIKEQEKTLKNFENSNIDYSQQINQIKLSIEYAKEHKKTIASLKESAKSESSKINSIIENREIFIDKIVTPDDIENFKASINNDNISSLIDELKSFVLLDSNYSNNDYETNKKVIEYNAKKYLELKSEIDTNFDLLKKLTNSNTYSEVVKKYLNYPTKSLDSNLYNENSNINFNTIKAFMRLDVTKDYNKKSILGIGNKFHKKINEYNFFINVFLKKIEIYSFLIANKIVPTIKEAIDINNNTKNSNVTNINNIDNHSFKRYITYLLAAFYKCCTEKNNSIPEKTENLMFPEEILNLYFLKNIRSSLIKYNDFLKKIEKGENTKDFFIDFDTFYKFFRYILCNDNNIIKLYESVLKSESSKFKSNDYEYYDDKRTAYLKSKNYPLKYYPKTSDINLENFDLYTDSLPNSKKMSHLINVLPLTGINPTFNNLTTSETKNAVNNFNDEISKIEQKMQDDFNDALKDEVLVENLLKAVDETGVSTSDILKCYYIISSIPFERENDYDIKANALAKNYRKINIKNRIDNLKIINENADEIISQVGARVLMSIIYSFSYLDFGNFSLNLVKCDINKLVMPDNKTKISSAYKNNLEYLVSILFNGIKYFDLNKFLKDREIEIDDNIVTVENKKSIHSKFITCRGSAEIAFALFLFYNKNITEKTELFTIASFLSSNKYLLTDYDMDTYANFQNKIIKVGYSDFKKFILECKKNKFKGNLNLKSFPIQIYADNEVLLNDFYSNFNGKECYLIQEFLKPVENIVNILLVMSEICFVHGIFTINKELDSKEKIIAEIAKIKTFLIEFGCSCIKENKSANLIYMDFLAKKRFSDNTMFLKNKPKESLDSIKKKLNK